MTPAWQQPLLRLQSALAVVLERAPLVDVVLPVVTLSEANRRDAWGKAKRAKVARTGAHMAISTTFLRSGSDWSRPGPWSLVVLLVRVAPRGLDEDNLAGALKAVQDGVADALGINDRDPRVTWVRSQEQGRAAVRIAIYEGRAP